MPDPRPNLVVVFVDDRLPAVFADHYNLRGNNRRDTRKIPHDWLAAHLPFITRLSADEIAELLRESGAKLWANPDLCVSAGTLDETTDPLILRAQDALLELRRAVERLIESKRSARLGPEMKRFLSGIGSQTEQQHRDYLAEAKRFLAQLRKVPSFLEPAGMACLAHECANHSSSIQSDRRVGQRLSERPMRALHAEDA
jgi:hypothetical protein